MNRSRLVILVVALVALAAVGGGVALYRTFLAGDAVAELTLDTPAPSGAAATVAPSPDPTAVADPSATPGSASPAPGTASGAVDLAGTWTVASGVAGYRVRETFLQQNADTDAVGRTEGVVGSITVSGGTGALSLDAASLTVDMTTLRSDRDRRDAQLRGRAIETERFPTSTFELARSVAVPADLLTGDVALTLPGTLTLHGVSRSVEISAQARLEADGTVVVVGSLPILFADYGIEPPDVAGIISVRDNGTMEFRVVLAKG